MHLKLKKIIDDYVECNNFEIKIIDKKVKIYYYDNIERFTSNLIEVSNKNDRFIIRGKNLVIETMFVEYMVISGDIKMIELGYHNE